MGGQTRLLWSVDLKWNQGVILQVRLRGDLTAEPLPRRILPSLRVLRRLAVSRGSALRSKLVTHGRLQHDGNLHSVE